MVTHCSRAAQERGLPLRPLGSEQRAVALAGVRGYTCVASRQKSGTHSRPRTTSTQQIERARARVVSPCLDKGNNRRKHEEGAKTKQKTKKRTSNKPEYRAASGARSADLTARHEVPFESRSWQWVLQDQLGGHAHRAGRGRIRFTSHASSTAISLSTASTGFSTRAVGGDKIVWRQSGTLLLRLLAAQALAGDASQGSFAEWIDVPWAVVLSQTRSHSSLSAFGAAAKRMLTGLALRRLWMLDVEMRLLADAITVRGESKS